MDTVRAHVVLKDVVLLAQARGQSLVAAAIPCVELVERHDPRVAVLHTHM